MPPKEKVKRQKATKVAPAPVEVTRLSAREISPRYYEDVTLTEAQIPTRLRDCNRLAVMVAFRLAGGDVRPRRATPDDRAWRRVQSGGDGAVYLD